MSYVVKMYSGKVVCQVSTVEEALIAEASHMRVDAQGYGAVLELAKARVAADPGFNSFPEEEEKYVTYKAKRSGKVGIYEVVRLFNPGDDGAPQHVELMSVAHADGSFVVPASDVTVFDINSLHPALANAILQGDAYEQNGGGNTPKLTKGLRR